MSKAMATLALVLFGGLFPSAPVSAQGATGTEAPAPPPSPLVLGNKLYEKGEYAAAADQYLLATRMEKFGVNRAFAWFNLGNCRMQIKAYHKAVVAYKRSLEEQPSFTRAWQQLGDAYYTLGAIGEAIPCYRRVIEQDGPASHPHQLLGECALRAGDVTEALRNFEAALKIEPDQPDIYLAMAEAHGRIRDFESAQKVMQDALLLLPSPPAEMYFYLGQLYELGGNDRKAVRAYEEGLLIDPRRLDYFMRVAGIHEQKGDDFLALLILERAIKSGLRKPELHVRRGVILFGQKRYDKALDDFQAAWALGSRQGRSGIENVAAAYYNQGDLKKSEEVLRSIN